ncbi:smoothelin-like protein 2 isoform X2 [Lissotriton helveticus]
MESAVPSSSEIADLSSQDAQSVCEALGRYEETLRGAVREIHVDIQVFKHGVERQLEDVLRLAGPLPRSVSDLQQENRSLRAQVLRLAEQVERLARCAGLPEEAGGSDLPGAPGTPGDKVPTSLPLTPCTPGGTLPGTPCTPGGTLPGTPCTPGGTLLGSPSAPWRNLPGSPSTPVGSMPSTPWTPPGSLPGSPGVASAGGSLPGSPSTSRTRFSSHALLSVSGKSQSLEQDVQNEMESQLKMSNEVASHGQTGSLSSQDHSPTTALRMPHLPVTAVTRVSEKFSAESSTSFSTNSSSSHLGHSNKNHNEAATKTSNQSASAVKTWSAGSVRTMGVSVTSEKNSSVTSVTKSVSSKSYSASSGTQSSEGASDSYFDVTPKSRSPPPAIHRQVEKRRELVRSQTLPRTSGTQARKAFFEKIDPEIGKAKGQSKVTLKRSQSFGMASASSIKQVLLEWCKSKTIGYKKIDLQNFSSSWSDGMAFCALVHSFFPEAFDYDALVPTNHKQNFELAFSMAEKLANCDRLIEVEDMLMMGRKPDPMCVFTYVQSLYNHLRRFE